MTKKTIIENDDWALLETRYTGAEHRAYYQIWHKLCPKTTRSGTDQEKLWYIKRKCSGCYGTIPMKFLRLFDILVRL